MWRSSSFFRDLLGYVYEAFLVSFKVENRLSSPLSMSRELLVEWVEPHSMFMIHANRLDAPFLAHACILLA